MKILTSPGSIDRRATAYSSVLHYCKDESYTSLEFCTVYGFVTSGTVTFNNSVVHQYQWFSCPIIESQEFVINGTAVLISRLGYLGQATTGGPIEEAGRLTYIDGCSDSLLVYPPRLGDPSLNVLYFPKNIDQTFHIHPSIRMGIVAKGYGICSLPTEEIPLTVGTVFCLDVMEKHRFRTTDSEMVVIAYHPDGDWGPTDHNHTMLNRTYM